MVSYKAPSFADRAALASEAKQRAIDRMRAKPAPDPAVVAARAAAREAKEAALAEKAAEKKRIKQEAEERAKAEAEAALLAQQKSRPPELTEAERKAARDAKYAARRNRKR